ncbi:hypothetical protein BDA96_01G298800 [Sorghum bicolor]|uniref:Uncharacterized protein n=1 Tax=Sorghum bicolor TaxID=4558 RepID=A0A921S1Q6_SORBI|nr:hypothetical protein BDA96_01G298800 [Sorghum bicolor]
MAQASSSFSIVLLFLALVLVLLTFYDLSVILYTGWCRRLCPIERNESSLLSTYSQFQCPDKCGYRCSATSHRKPCLFFCNYCCQKCLCVPSGTYGNKEECPCYDNLKTKEGGPKCP